MPMQNFFRRYCALKCHAISACSRALQSARLPTLLFWLQLSVSPLLYAQGNPVSTSIVQNLPQASLNGAVSAATPGASSDDIEQTLGASVSQAKLELALDQRELADLLQTHLAELSAPAVSLNPAFLRRVRLQVADILATEAYFAPTINWRWHAPDSGQNSADTPVLVLQVAPGARSVVENVTLRFKGALAEDSSPAAQQLRRQLQEDWSLAVGSVFRDADWSAAKTQLQDSLRSHAYAAARISHSQAEVDAEFQRVRILLDIDSGPVFYFGALQVKGLQRYPRSLLDGFRAPSAGEVFDLAQINDYQRALQNSAYFAGASISYNADPDNAAAMPLELVVTERQSRQFSLGLGYSTNTGYRGEIAYRDRNIASRGLDLHSALRLEQRQQLFYSDLYLPPRQSGLSDSLGLLVQRSDVSDLKQDRWAIGLQRIEQRGKLEQKLGLHFEREQVQVLSGEIERSRSLIASIGWTWRELQNPDYRLQGQMLSLELAGAEKALASDQRFIRVQSKYQRWLNLSPQNDLIARIEFGQVFANASHGIPEDYLFRTGGSNSVRGYSYQGLGVPDQGSIRGGRVMLAGGLEWQHWLNKTWGIASFIDAGDAAASWREFSLKQGMGVGARFRSPAGPLGLDLAYGRQSKKIRLDFSISLSF